MGKWLILIYGFIFYQFKIGPIGKEIQKGFFKNFRGVLKALLFWIIEFLSSHQFWYFQIVIFSFSDYKIYDWN